MDKIKYICDSKFFELEFWPFIILCILLIFMFILLFVFVKIELSNNEEKERVVK